MRLLLTGFPPFTGCSVNPTAELVRTVRKQGVLIPGIELRAELLPVEYDRVEREFCRLLREHQPDAVLAFGVGRQDCAFRLEQRGVNLDDAEIPDNSGETRRQSTILNAGAPEQWVDEDLPDLLACLEAAGLDAELGAEAGGYICNHLLYYALQILSNAPVRPRFLFTHVAAEEKGMTTEILLRGLHIMVRWLQNQPARPFDPLVALYTSAG